jgi:hypothetical protein
MAATPHLEQVLASSALYPDPVRQALLDGIAEIRGVVPAVVNHRDLGAPQAAPTKPPDPTPAEALRDAE